MRLLYATADKSAMHQATNYLILYLTLPYNMNKDTSNNHIHTPTKTVTALHA